MLENKIDYMVEVLQYSESSDWTGYAYNLCAFFRDFQDICSPTLKETLAIELEELHKYIKEHARVHDCIETLRTKKVIWS